MKKRIKFDELRKDIPKKGLTQKQVLENAEYTEGGFVKIYGELSSSIEEG